MGNIIGEKLWTQRENHRPTKLVQVKATEVRVGDHYEYRGAGTITRDATYEANVIKVTEHIVVMDIVIDQARSNIERFGVPRSYCIAIQKNDIGRTERLYRRAR